MSYEVFAKRKVRGVEGLTPHITLTAHGLIRFNRRAQETLGGARALRLWFDRETRSLALEPFRPEDRDAFPLHRQNSQAVLSARHALRRLEILPATRSQRFRAIWNPEKKWLEASLEAFAG
jgi:hypothetical protein